MMAKKIDSTSAGVWIWGCITILLAILAVSFLLYAGTFIDRNGNFLPETPQPVAGIFYALKACGSLVGGVLGFSALAWAHFFQAARNTVESDSPKIERPNSDAPEDAGG